MFRVSQNSFQRGCWTTVQQPLFYCQSGAADSRNAHDDRKLFVRSRFTKDPRLRRQLAQVSSTSALKRVLRALAGARRPPPPHARKRRRETCVSTLRRHRPTRFRIGHLRLRRASSVSWSLQISLGAHRVLGAGQYRRPIGTLTLVARHWMRRDIWHFTPRSRFRRMMFDFLACAVVSVRVQKLHVACAHRTKRPEARTQFAEMTEVGVSWGSCCDPYMRSEKSTDCT
jgi:hypothetical protein